MLAPPICSRSLSSLLAVPHTHTSSCVSLSFLSMSLPFLALAVFFPSAGKYCDSLGTIAWTYVSAPTEFWSCPVPITADFCFSCKSQIFQLLIYHQLLLDFPFAARNSLHRPPQKLLNESGSSGPVTVSSLAHPTPPPANPPTSS